MKGADPTVDQALSQCLSEEQVKCLTHRPQFSRERSKVLISNKSNLNSKKEIRCPQFISLLWLLFDTLLIFFFIVKCSLAFTWTPPFFFQDLIQGPHCIQLSSVQVSSNLWQFLSILFCITLIILRCTGLVSILYDMPYLDDSNVILMIRLEQVLYFSHHVIV